MEAPGFWDDSERAGKVSAEHARVARRLEMFRTLEGDVEDLDGSDGARRTRTSRWRRRSSEQIASAETRLAALEEQRLFSGPYDSGDALVSVNAGAGGTDAQDWAEMVLRMEMRWAESRGFQVELLEASAGEEAGIKSATFRVAGENAYGLFGAERGRAPPRAPLPVRLRPPPPDELRRRGGRAGRGGRRRDRDRRRRPAGGHLPRLRRRRPARQQDRLRGAHHPPPDGDRRAVPERALAVLQPRDRDGDAARQAARTRASANARRRSPARRARRRTSTSARRSAPTCCTPTRSSRTTARATRWATCSACSTGTWTGSSGPICCAQPQPPEEALNRVRLTVRARTSAPGRICSRDAIRPTAR